MRAVLHFLSFADATYDFNEHFSPITKIFKASGKIRDLDVTSECIRRIAKGDGKEISNTLRKERLRKYRNIRKTATQELLRNLPKIPHESIHQDKIAEYLGNMLSDIRNKSNKKMNTTRLHGIRKLCKEYLYISRAGGKEIYNRTRENLIHLDPLQKQIGTWHDYVIASEVIKTIMKTSDARDHILRILKEKERKYKERAIKILEIIK